MSSVELLTHRKPHLSLADLWSLRSGLMCQSFLPSLPRLSLCAEYPCTFPSLLKGYKSTTAHWDPPVMIPYHPVPLQGPHISRYRVHSHFTNGVHFYCSLLSENDSRHRCLFLCFSCILVFFEREDEFALLVDQRLFFFSPFLIAFRFLSILVVLRDSHTQ